MLHFSLFMAILGGCRQSLSETTLHMGDDLVSKQTGR